MTTQSLFKQQTGMGAEEHPEMYHQWLQEKVEEQLEYKKKIEEIEEEISKVQDDSQNFFKSEDDE